MINEVVLEELLDIPIRNGLTKPSRIRGNGVKMIGMGELFAHDRISSSLTMNLVPVTEKEMESSRILKNDLLFARQSLVLEGAGKCSIVIDVSEDIVFESHLIRLRIDSQKANPVYLYYYFQSTQGRNRVRSIVEQVAAAGIRGKDLIKLKVPCPDLEDQNRIAFFLERFDRRIETNILINENLSQQIQLIYNEFADGLYGNTFELSSIIDVRDGTHDSPKSIEGGYPLVTSKHLLPYGVDLSSANLISKEDFEKTNERSLVETYDILISMIGTVGLISLVIENPVPYAIKNVGLFKTSKRPDLFAYILPYLRSTKTTQHIERALAGSTQKYISLGELRKLPIILPDEETLKRYNNIVFPLIKQIINLIEENKRLIGLRDTLLPRLMSGELDVSSLDI